MWFSGCLLAAPTTLFPSILSFPLPSFICVLPIPVFFLCFFSPLSWLAPVHSVNSPCKNRSLSKVYENHNILAFLASEGTLWSISEAVIAREGGEKKCDAGWKERMRHWKQKGRLENMEIRKKEKRESARKIQEAGREREGGRGGTENEA